MGQEWRTVTEYVPFGDRLVVWSIEDRTVPGQPVYEQFHACRSPLTGWWFTVLADGSGARFPRLRDVRRALFGGNGQRVGGHSEIAHVRNVPRYGHQLHRHVITGGQ